MASRNIRKIQKVNNRGYPVVYITLPRNVVDELDRRDVKEVEVEIEGNRIIMHMNPSQLRLEFE